MGHAADPCPTCNNALALICSSCNGLGCPACEGDGDRPCPSCNVGAVRPYAPWWPTFPLTVEVEPLREEAAAALEGVLLLKKEGGPRPAHASPMYRRAAHAVATLLGALSFDVRAHLIHLALLRLSAASITAIGALWSERLRHVAPAAEPGKPIKDILRGAICLICGGRCWEDPQTECPGKLARPDVATPADAEPSAPAELKAGLAAWARSTVPPTPAAKPAPRFGGAPTCPHPCVECRGGHHFSVALIRATEDEAEIEQRQGVSLWWQCKHCDAWIELTGEEEDGPDVSVFRPGELCGYRDDRYPTIVCSLDKDHEGLHCPIHRGSRCPCSAAAPAAGELLEQQIAEQPAAVLARRVARELGRVLEMPPTCAAPAQAPERLSALLAQAALACDRLAAREEQRSEDMSPTMEADEELLGALDELLLVLKGEERKDVLKLFTVRLGPVKLRRAAEDLRREGMAERTLELFGAREP